MSEHPHRSGDLLPAALQSSLARRTPLLWINEHWRPFDAGAIAAALDPRGMYDAEVRLSQYAVVLKRLFPELPTVRASLNPRCCRPTGCSGE